jgi:glucokinase
MERREKKYTQSIPTNTQCLLVADIGGTNSNFGVFAIKNDHLELAVSIHYKSKEVTDYGKIIAEIISYLDTTYKITIKQCCIAAAGIVSENRDLVNPTNLAITIDAKQIKKEARLDEVVIINDFEAVGFGVTEIAKKDLVAVNVGTPRTHANKAIIGAGTGLGKGILGWNESQQRYIPITSEGGHADFAIQNQFELDFADYIRNTEKGACAISWEDILSGKGIIRLYNYLGTTGAYEKTAYTELIEKNGHHPDLIFKNHVQDPRCARAYELFSTWYARCAKNFALDSLALAGVYIAGGIAANNISLFKIPAFWHEFVNCGKQMETLTTVPVYVITDYNVSLYGAARYLLIKNITY